jgi:hypothetical protein
MAADDGRARLAPHQDEVREFEPMRFMQSLHESGRHFAKLLPLPRTAANISPACGFKASKRDLNGRYFYLQ